MEHPAELVLHSVMGYPGMQQTILMVEDEAIIRMSTVAALEDAGYGVLKAQNSAEALEQLAQHAEIGILLTDVRMPGHMNGLALVTKVRADYPAIRAIVMSAHSTAEEASAAGVLGFVLKPYMPQAIIRAMQDMRLPIRPKEILRLIP